jgi:uncharacterized membrane protein
LDWRWSRNQSHNSRNAYETVEILEWNALLSIFGAGQGASAAPISGAISAKRAMPASAKGGATLQARGGRGVWPRGSFVAARCGDAPHSLLAIRPFCLYARPIPVFQRSHMSFLAFFLIVVSLLSFVAAQLILKRAMEATRTGFPNTQFVSKITSGILLMTISFFLTLGLLQRFDLSYLYPFQGLSVIFITLIAGAVLKEKLNMRLTVGALLISVGIVLVSLS